LVGLIPFIEVESMEFCMDRDCSQKKMTALKTINYERMRGFSLAELMVAMAMGLVVLGTAYNIFTVQNKSLSSQEQIVEMQQSVRAAMDIICRDARMAGYNPAGTTFAGVTVNASQLEIKADRDGDAIISASDNVIYAHDATNMRINKTTGGTTEPLAENIEALTFQYLDAAGNVTTSSADVRMIRITITGRTALSDPLYPSNSGYRTYLLTTNIIPRNLSI